MYLYFFFFFQAEDGIRDRTVTGVQTCALPISSGQINLSVLPAGVGMTLGAGAISLGNGAPASGSVIVQSSGALNAAQFAAGTIRSEERRVGKECRSGGSARCWRSDENEGIGVQ